MRHCIFCDRTVEAWVPYRIAQPSQFLLRVGATGSNLQRFGCPHCGSTDRERHLRLFFDKLNVWAAFKGGAILHMAPEPVLGAAINKCAPSRYVRGDLFPTTPEIEKIDLQAISAPSETFDVVICNHMLEHVALPGVALAEVCRVLRPGGRFICQTPYAKRLTTTLEDPLFTSDEDRLFFYGQEDHARLFGLDIEQTLKRAGLAGGLKSHDDLLPGIDPEEYGVNEFEPFFDFVRT
jgi:SAM-dependent methyltransferase